MILLVLISIAFILSVVLFYRFIGVERGVDKHKENVNAVVIGKEPYVTPAIDTEIQEQMRNLQQMYIPVQYIDNGLMPRITRAVSAKGGSNVEKALKSTKYNGPIAFYEDNLSSSTFQEAKFTDSLKNFQPNATVVEEIPSATVVEEIEPFNSFLGMIASEGQNVSAYD